MEQGHLVLPLTAEQRTLCRQAWREYNGFGNFWLFQHVPQWKEPPIPEPVVWDVLDDSQTALHRLLLGGRTKERSATALAEHHVGDKLAFRHRRINHGKMTMIPRSGLGMGTSDFEGAAHLTLQLQLAQQHLAPLYRQRGEELAAAAVAQVEKLAAPLEPADAGSLWREIVSRDPRRTNPPLRGPAAKLQALLRALRTALGTRQRRIQGQVPTRSILQFARGSPEAETLFHLIAHPEHGVPGLAVNWKDTLPFVHPLSGQDAKDFEGMVSRMNHHCATIHRHYRQPQQASMLYGPWVEKMRPLMDAFATELGLDRDWTPFTLAHPEAKDALLLWTGYHATVNHWQEEGQKRQEEGIKRSLFLDAVPRRIFSEHVWALVWACHRVAIVDLGAGHYRGSEWGYCYRQEKKLPTGAQTVQDQRLWPLLGAPTEDRSGVVLVPERQRLKWEGVWGCFHIDHTPLPERLLQAARTLRQGTKRKR
jgi:hypothetical protein